MPGENASKTEKAKITLEDTPISELTRITGVHSWGPSGSRYRNQEKHLEKRRRVKDEKNPLLGDLIS